MLLNGVVIGSSVEAAYYSLVNDLFFIPTKKIPPMFYEQSPVRILGLTNKSEIWTKLNLMLGLLSKKISFGQDSNIRVVDDTIRITSENVTFKYQFENLYVFDPTGVQLENEIKVAMPKTYKVLDDFEISTLGPKRYQLEPITSKCGFVKEMHFYCSGRVDGSDYITDCMVESELTYEQINSFDYSDSMVRFAVERHLTSIGVYGRLMKYYTSGKPKYRKPKVVHVKRLAFEIDNNKYKDNDKVFFLDKNLRDIIEESTKR